MLGGTDYHGKPDHEEDDGGAAEPNHHVNGELLTPSHPHIFTWYPSKDANQEVWNEPCEEIHKEHPSLSASGDRNHINLLQLGASRLLVNDVVLLQAVEHVASNAGGSLRAGVDVPAAKVVSSLVVVQFASSRC